MYSAAKIIRPPSINPDISSYLPCPKGCLLSAGSDDFITAKNVRTDARKSLRECTASEIILILPERIPAISFNKIITAFEQIDNPAANFFCVTANITDIMPPDYKKVKN